ncbi:division/cell wall cluster transcriptional repressor MraZ [Sulfoacidibacillus thermotolerans]|uniref:Transcriptional regulator MraZ n=1 Tax=Sulfoacidibacillus thermotolerans TaxID=1765684 RepID=A0A2U3D940_SULT2|nr:division/cell wall cluster transcriptional repressor MraZ [Sulfoacidibacillus thermotolerans]PWI57785.1 cell division/cell wall cluster transcriptional repressor MraZ [Sulfoacidibacillus thermotolerans]
MFMGEYQHALDDKGRITIPAKFREELGTSFVITRGLDHCLFVYPRKDWEALEAKLRAMPLSRADARQFMRFFFSGAAESELDKQGRVLLPMNLRDYAHIARDCVVIGVGARVEIWDLETWKSYTSDAEDQFSDLASGLVDLDL